MPKNKKKINSKKKVGLNMIPKAQQQSRKNSKQNVKMPPPISQKSVKLKKAMKPNANLREKMLFRIDSARLRFLNDEMYNDNKKVLKNKAAFKVYHESFQKQQKLWESNPLDIIIKDLKTLFSNSQSKEDFCIADLGCGEAKIADAFQETALKVHSIDFVAVNSKVTACDMAHTNIPSNSVDVVVFCLALMSSNCKSYIREAKRILKETGHLLIAEVTSRIENEKIFIDSIKDYGFTLYGKIPVSEQYFTYFKFRNKGKMKSKAPEIILKPCKYKKR